MYNVDFNKVTDWMIPPRKRWLWHRVWLRSLMSPVLWIQGEFNTYRTRVDYKLKHTGQVCYLKKVLNDEFDVTQRRINVFSAQRVSARKIFRRGEWPALDPSEKMVVQRRADDLPVVLYRRLETSFAGGFIVDVPFRINDAQYYQMRSLVEFYKLASKSYFMSYMGWPHIPDPVDNELEMM